MNEIAKTTTSLSSWTTWATTEVTNSFANAGVTFDEYNKQCALAAMSSIYQLVQADDKTDMQQLDTSSLRDAVGQAAALRLNSNASPSECYFTLRKKKQGDKWITKVEMGIQGDGYSALLRNFGNGVREVYPEWVVHEGDDFKYPTYKGVEIQPPEWQPKNISTKVDKVVTIVRMANDSIQYEIAERASAKVNLMAHIRNNMMNETFGICESRYKATQEQLKQIADKKAEILNAITDEMTVDDMLKLESIQPYLSPVWREMPEVMIARKLSNNNAKKFKKNFDNLAKRSFIEMDETFKAAQEEIAENENTEDFENIIDGQIVAETAV